MSGKIRQFWRDDSGQELAEYAVLLAMIALLVMAALRFIGPALARAFDAVNSNLEIP